MSIFFRQIQFVDGLEQLIFEQLKNTINSVGIELERAITEDQLFEKGIDGKEKKLRGYKRTTIRIKIANNQPVDRTTLRDKNTFHPSIRIDAFSDRFEVSSNVNHAKFLINNYGEDILRPTSKNLEKFLLKNLIPSLKIIINDKFTK